ncbi:MAG: gliding motility-associated C-terminal domain-containing protein [Flavobacteriales bacterium]|nr:gliding motility-associated C-terminal domain-containing protein [Flavobacteriales bacterium]
MAPGPYTYTVTGVAPCTNASATVTVNETGNPDAGTDGSITVCGNGAEVSLFGQLGGSPDAGGTWSGGLVGGIYDPAVNGPGNFTYTLAAVAPCLGDVSTVTVTENAPTDAGSDGSLTICTSSAAVALINSLGGSPQGVGTWSPAAPGGNYDPATMAPGPYTYTVTGVAPCTNASATVTVNETGNPDAGTDGSITVCGNGAEVSLFAELGGSPDAGGTWSGGLVGGIYDPSTNGPGAFTYTLAAVAPCLGDVATVTVTEEAVPNAGTDAALNICAGAPTQDLFDLLGSNAQSGGTWSGPTNPFDGIFDPGTDLGGLYSYTINGVVCPNDAATIGVVVAVGPDAGQDNTIALCNTSGPVSLNSLLLGTPDVGGVWTDVDGIVVPNLFNPSNMTGGTFTYTVLGNSSCPADAAVLQLTVNAAPHAGTSGSMALCTSSGPVSLFDGLTGNLDIGGTWTGPNGQGHSSTLDPAVDTSGIYMYRVPGTAPCLDATSTVLVVISPEPDAGENGAAIFCSSDLPLELITLLNGMPQTNGVWRGPDGNIEGSSFAPGTGAPGVHTYTITGIAPCGVDLSSVTIAVSTAANAGVNTSISVCENSDDPLELITALGGSPETTGTWYAPDSSLFDGPFDPSEDVGGAYFYTVSAPAPCPVDTAVLTITVIPIPLADIQVDGNDGCTPALVTLSNSYTGNGSCTWILWNGDVINDCAPIQYVFEEEGTFDVTLIIDAGDGCGADTVQGNDLIHIFQQPVAEFHWLPEAVNTVDPEVQFNNASIGGNNFLWTIADLDTATSYNANYRFPEVLGAEYEVCLVAAASAFCSDTVCHIIEVEDGLAIFVPNAFSPDGDDINEGFKPIVGGVDLRFYRFDIFDRWGQQLFGTDDPNAVWNGRFTNGTDVPIGVYVWKLLAKDPYTGKRIERIGHVTLVR